MQKYKIRIPGVRTDKVEVITVVAKPNGNILVCNEPISE